MNDELFEEDVDPLVVAESKLTAEQTAAMVAYYRSCILKQVGFVPHAAVQRAVPDFTKDDLKRAVFDEPRLRANDGDRGHLDFTIREDGRLIKIDVSGLRPWMINYRDDAPYTLFDLKSRGLSYNTGHPENIFVVEGYLYHEELEVDMAALVKVLGIEHADGRALHLEPVSDDDMYLKVLAVVLFDHEGNPVDSLVQVLPSQVDQVVHLPS